MAYNSSVGTWSFHPLVTAFPPTILPNIAYWNITNGTWEYQVHISWPLNWTATNVESTVDTLYVLDGNALAHTATEAFRKRRSVDSPQQDTIVVGIGYPETIPDSPYSEGRYYDYQIPVCPTCPPPPPDQPGVPSNGENFLTFIDEVLRPWIRQAFPNVKFNRDALYGHSFAGLFTIYTLIEHPEMFDVYLSASPFLYWNNEYIFSLLWPLKPGLQHGKGNGKTKPALQISYGGYEQDFPKRRTETHKEHQERKAFLSQFKYADLTERLYAEVKDSPALRHVELNVYPFSYHAAVGAAALNDGIDYFLDW